MGADECADCQFDLTALDRPVPSDVVEASLMTDRVATLKPRPPVCVPDTADLGRAMAAMLRERVGAVLVTRDDGTLVGILTERDFLTKIAGCDTLALLPVRQFMTRDPETVRLHDPLAFALRQMDVGRYRHLPVVHDDRPVGVISVKDILRHMLNLCQPRVKVR